MRIRLFAAVVAVVLAGSGCAGREAPSPAWASFTELGLTNVPMKPGANVRVFDEASVNAHDLIRYDKTDGYLTLEPGTYRVDGWSLTTFGYELTPEQRAAAFSAPGYAYLWNADENKFAILGSMQDPLDSQPSVLDGIVEVPKTTRYYLAHQNGRNVSGIYLQVYDPRATMPDGSVSTNHAFAQLVVERL
ncbi:hypothetical protein ORI20_24245 [Mycobacterium sp. CVI_P3]|uniref:Lipoprotein n=1 Tax=Mycobacterium pinniadriaticum TaxID=2994102 RepID=A0ABT3SJV7_9MYCO|nr:hypothetical protein [Mycobacterium pinniadriaticum]MCX2933387.1 hypothetical protein [Mycobacterium pinniadriaticum]MCX2939809.1 hypothetical protein [Mycobacterium pinniadriaticum]